MGANPIIYCLENLTDYFEFERLATDLMVLEGFKGIEPLGGFSDKGRDAIHVHKSGKTTLFAYSVRENWRVKLSEDAGKIKKHDHTCDDLIFVTTSDFSASERDEAIASIKKEYGWDLQLYGQERLRVLLEVEHRDVVSRHPQIFNPNVLNHQSIPVDNKHVFISYVEQDWGLADWLSRKLTAEGYFVWCERFKLLGGEKYPDNIEEAINNLTFRVIALYSKASLQNQEVMRQRYLAMDKGRRMGIDFLIPLNVDGLSSSLLDSQTSSLVFIPFHNNWGNGLQQLLHKLDSINCPKGVTDGVKIAASANWGSDVLEKMSEDLYLNYFPILDLPKYLYVFESRNVIPWEELQQIALEWAYKKIGSRYYLSFHEPPHSISQSRRIQDIDSIEWRELSSIQTHRVEDVLSELLKKSLYVKCNERGLLYCEETNLHYFPGHLIDGNWLKVVKPDGTKTRVLSNGKRTFPFPKEEYLYSLAPIFHVVNDVFENPVIQIGVRVRIADTDFKPLPPKKRQSRRKHLCHDWWNEEWFVRMLAICQFIADDDQIIMGGTDEEKIIISTHPCCLSSPVSINEKAFDLLMEERKRFKELLGQPSNEDEEESLEFLYEEDDD